MRTLLAAIAVLCSPHLALAQGPPPPPPPLQPLQVPPAPPQNQVTTNKADLGRALFWDEQLSSSNTMACGTCHFSTSGGSDPRSTQNNQDAIHPGFDGVFGTPDDVVGSPGVVRSFANGDYELDAAFGLRAQVTSRKSPSTLMAAYSPLLFWDGRATGALVDPITSQVVIPVGAALESQVLQPPVSDVEMGHIGSDWNGVVQRVTSSRPLALSPQVPPALSTWIAGRSYPQLFQEVFGSSNVTPTRIAMAIATYERTLAPTQTPLDAFLATGQGLTALEQQGLQLFGQLNCAGCHAGSRFTDENFHYTGVRPVQEDLGRFDVTGAQPDRGAFRTPSLRNVRDRGPFMHDGSLATLADVVDFYNRGGDFNAPNKAPAMQPLGLNQQQKNALVAFMGRPLTDQRAVDQTGPFARPLLYTESVDVPQVIGTPTIGSGGSTPRMVAVEPANVGNANFTLGLERALGGAAAWLVIDAVPALAGVDVLGATSFVALSPSAVIKSVILNGSGPKGGFTSKHFAINAPGLAGLVIFAQWFVLDTGAPGGLLSASAATRVQIFD